MAVWSSFYFTIGGTMEENDFDFCKRPNAVVTVVALYDKPQSLPLPDMYGKNLTFKTYPYLFP